MAHPEPHRAYRTLVVEDEGLIALDIARRLEALGHEPLGPASTAEEAIGLAADADIVLMDIRIDGQRDGIEAAKEIRARYHIPVIFLTAHADRATLERAKQAGPFGYIVKPLGPSSLQTAIEMAIAKHRLERLLEEREAWLRAVIGSIADAAMVVSPDGSVRLLNPVAEKCTGWTQAEAEGKPSGVVARLSGAGDGSDFDPISLALLRGAPVEFGRDTRLVSRDGREMEVEGFAAPVQTSQGIAGVALTFRDASARRWEEKQLRQAQRLEAAGRLAAAAAAEYSTLIGVIRAETETLLRQFGEFSAARTALERVQQAALAADQITRRLEMFGTRQAGHPETLSVNRVLRRMAPLIEAAAGSAIRVSIRPSPGAGRVRTDAAQLESAILSLVAHACEAIGPDPGQLAIDTARVELPGHAAPYVLLSVNYTAIEPEIERLFDAASPDRSSLARAQVHWLAAEYGGYVSARSHPQEGSRIELLLPSVTDQAMLCPPSDGAATILLVEESEAVRAELHNFFEAAGYNLIEAHDADEAAALGEIHEGSINLVICEAAKIREVWRGLTELHPGLRSLSIVEQGEPGPDQIRRPFLERDLLEKAAALLGKQPEPAAQV